MNVLDQGWQRNHDRWHYPAHLKVSDSLQNCPLETDSFKISRNVINLWCRLVTFLWEAKVGQLSDQECTFVKTIFSKFYCWIRKKRKSNYIYCSNLLSHVKRSRTPHTEKHWITWSLKEMFISLFTNSITPKHSLDPKLLQFLTNESNSCRSLSQPHR